MMRITLVLNTDRSASDAIFDYKDVTESEFLEFISINQDYRFKINGDAMYNVLSNRLVELPSRVLHPFVVDLIKIGKIKND